MGAIEQAMKKVLFVLFLLASGALVSADSTSFQHQIRSRFHLLNENAQLQKENPQLRTAYALIQAEVASLRADADRQTGSLRKDAIKVDQMDGILADDTELVQSRDQIGARITRVQGSCACEACACEAD